MGNVVARGNGAGNRDNNVSNDDVIKIDPVSMSLAY